MEMTATGMEERTKALVPNQVVNQATSKSVSRPSRIDSVHSPSPSHKGENCKSDSFDFGFFKHHYRSHCSQWRQAKVEKLSWTKNKSIKSGDSVFNSQYDTD